MEIVKDYEWVKHNRALLRIHGAQFAKYQVSCTYTRMTFQSFTAAQARKAKPGHRLLGRDNPGNPRMISSFLLSSFVL